MAEGTTLTDAPLVIDVQLNLQDHVKATYSYCWRRRKSNLVLLLLAVFNGVLAAGNALLSPGLPSLFYWGLATLWVAVLSNAANPYFFTKRHLKSNKAFYEPTRFAFSSDGFTRDSASVSTSVRWDALWRTFETKDSFLLFFSKATLFILPKRFFGGPSQLQAFRDVLRTSLPEKVRLA